MSLHDGIVSHLCDFSLGSRNEECSSVACFSSGYQLHYSSSSFSLCHVGTCVCVLVCVSASSKPPVKKPNCSLCVCVCVCTVFLAFCFCFCATTGHVHTPTDPSTRRLFPKFFKMFFLGVTELHNEEPNFLFPFYLWGCAIHLHTGACLCSLLLLLLLLLLLHTHTGIRFDPFYI